MNAFQSTSGLVVERHRKRSSTPQASLLSIPSIVTTGVGSTPTSELRRRPRSSPLDKNIINMHREYQLLQSQTLFLIATAALSFVLFLLFTLPFAALIGLTVMVTSLGALLLVAYAAVKTKYHMELEHPLGLIRHLPPTVQTHLTEKSLHSCLSPKPSSESLSSLSRYSHHNSLPQAPEQYQKLKTVCRVRHCTE